MVPKSNNCAVAGPPVHATLSHLLSEKQQGEGGSQFAVCPLATQQPTQKTEVSTQMTADALRTQSEAVLSGGPSRHLKCVLVHCSLLMATTMSRVRYSDAIHCRGGQSPPPPPSPSPCCHALRHNAHSSVQCGASGSCPVLWHMPVFNGMGASDACTLCRIQMAQRACADQS